jgi:leucyl-tRNA synthetase
MLGHTGGLARAAWPTFDPDVAKADEVVVPVQINGKVRARVTMAAGLPEEEMQQRVLADEGVRSHTTGKSIRKVVVAKGPIVSIVIA